MEIKLPKYDKEDAEKDFKNLKKGDVLVEFYYDRWYDRLCFRYLTVNNITPKGRVRFDDGSLYDNMGKLYLKTDEVKETIRKIRRRQELLSLVNKLERKLDKFVDVLLEEDEENLINILKSGLEFIE